MKMNRFHFLAETKQSLVQGSEAAGNRVEWIEFTCRMSRSKVRQSTFQESLAKSLLYTDSLSWKSFPHKIHLFTYALVNIDNKHVSHLPTRNRKEELVQ